MPLPIWLARKLSRRLASARLQKILTYLSPDGKTQVGIEYRNRKPKRIHSITVIASQNQEDTPNLKQLRDEIRRPSSNRYSWTRKCNRMQRHDFRQSDGPFIIGGPSVHSGLTGRKNAIDTYGEYSRHSGAALSARTL